MSFGRLIFSPPHVAALFRSTSRGLGLSTPELVGAIFPRSTRSFSRKLSLETAVWSYGVFTAIGLRVLLGVLRWKEPESGHIFRKRKMMSVLINLFHLYDFSHAEKS